MKGLYHLYLCIPVAQVLIAELMKVSVQLMLGHLQGRRTKISEGSSYHLLAQEILPHVEQDVSLPLMPLGPQKINRIFFNMSTLQTLIHKTFM